MQIQKRIERFREEGNFEAVKEYEQIYDVIIEVLDRLVALLGMKKCLWQSLLKY